MAYQLKDPALSLHYSGLGHICGIGSILGLKISTCHGQGSPPSRPKKNPTTRQSILLDLFMQTIDQFFKPLNF